MNIAAGSLAHHSRKMGIRESPRMRDRDEKVGRRMARVRRFCKEESAKLPTRMGQSRGASKAVRLNYARGLRRRDETIS